jgi:hypothetical protein
MGAGVFIFCLEILSLNEVAVGDVQRCLSEGVAVKVLGFNGLHITCISRYLANIFLLLQRLELIVNLFRDVSEWNKVYPVYPGTTYANLCPSNIFEVTIIL